MDDLKSEVSFGMLFARDNSEKSKRFPGDVEQKLGMHARGREVGH